MDNKDLRDIFTSKVSEHTNDIVIEKNEVECLSFDETITNAIIDANIPNAYEYLRALAGEAIVTNNRDDISNEEKQDIYLRIIRKSAFYYEMRTAELEGFKTFMTGYYENWTVSRSETLSCRTTCSLFDEKPMKPFEFWETLNILKAVENNLLKHRASFLNSQTSRHYFHTA